MATCRDCYYVDDCCPKQEIDIETCAKNLELCRKDWEEQYNNPQEPSFEGWTD